jgi:pimeloyl-ACP methyl ester carboxylesterase
MIATIGKTGAQTQQSARPQAHRHSKGPAFWLKRVGLGLLILLVTSIAAGAIYQAIATNIDKGKYPAPGQLVDVGGRNLHIYCTGDGSPTVLLESSLAGTTSLWGWVQPEVAKGTRVCAYDRAGSGWSDPGPKPRDGQRVAAELHTLLDKAGIAGPYVLVGHSLGGLYVRAYAGQYPAEVAGMVLVDSSHPDQWTLSPGGQEQYKRFEQFNSIGSMVAPLGMLRLFNFFPLNPDLPARQSAEFKAFSDSTKYANANVDEFNSIPELNNQVKSGGKLGAVPLAVLTATDHGYQAALAAKAPQSQLEQLQQQEQYWQKFQVEMAALSTNSTHRIVEGSDHGSLLTRHDHAIMTSATILQVVDAARTGRPLAR